ncbi:MAG: STAS domain-containing protein [Planctomycetota bacterium]
MKIDTETVAGKGVVILHVHGALDRDTVEDFADTLQDVFDQGIFKIVVDLVEVEYISSAGIGALVSGLMNAQQNHGDMVLIHPKPKILELFGLMDMFHFAADSAAATALF